MIGKVDRNHWHYLNKVMRIKENELFSLFNEEGEWEAKILRISKNIVEFKITNQLRQSIVSVNGNDQPSYVNGFID